MADEKKTIYLKHCEVVSQPQYIQGEVGDIIREHKVIKKFAYILHDKDPDTSPHYHIYLNFGRSSISLSDVAKWFGLQESCIERVKGRPVRRGKDFMNKKKHKGNYKAKKAYSSSKKHVNKKTKIKPKKKKKLLGIFQNKKNTYKATKHKSGMNYYVDKQGEYKQKPWFANFWKVGFLDDVPVGADYDREMDGIVYYDYVTDSYHTADEDSKRNLYGLERFQMSINRLWNGSPREWLKLIFRVLLIIFIITGWFALFHYLFSWEHTNLDNQVHDFMDLFDIFGLIN